MCDAALSGCCLCCYYRWCRLSVGAVCLSVSSIVNANGVVVAPTAVFALLLLLVVVFVALSGVATGAVTDIGAIEVVVVVVDVVAEGDTVVVIVDAVVDVIGVTIGNLCVITAGVCVSVWSVASCHQQHTYT